MSDYLGETPDDDSAPEALAATAEAMLDAAVSQLSNQKHQEWIVRVTSKNRVVMKMDRPKLLQVRSLDRPTLRTVKTWST